MKKLFIITGILFVLEGAVFAAQPVVPITLPYSNNFDCAEWTNENSELPGCNKVWVNQVGGGITTNGITNYTQITSDANRPGSAGRGLRIWYGYEGINQSVIPQLHFPAAQTDTEVWITYYARYEAGFKTSTNGNKMMYIIGGNNTNWNLCGGGYSYCQAYFHAPSARSSTGCDVYNTNDFDGKGYVGSGCGQTAIFGGSSSNGLWHKYEVHLKRETTSGSTHDGVLQVYFDNSLVIDNSSVTFGWYNGIGRIELPSNGGQGNVDRNYYLDVDDLQITTKRVSSTQQLILPSVMPSAPYGIIVK